jgi:hypothetical protein
MVASNLQGCYERGKTQCVEMQNTVSAANVRKVTTFCTATWTSYRDGVPTAGVSCTHDGIEMVFFIKYLRH